MSTVQVEVQGEVTVVTINRPEVRNAVALAEQLCQFPQLCMRGDRLSSYQQWGQPLDEAIMNETEIGRAVIQSGETQAGASRFASGKGRHGNFKDI